MTNYYIEKDSKIVMFDTDKTKIQTTLKFTPQYEGLEIKETERPLVLSEDMTYYVFADTDEYKQEQAHKEAERIAMLNLTRGDVFRGLLLAKGITRAQIKSLIDATPATTQEEIIAKEMAYIDFEEATNYYRGNSLIDTIAGALGITSKQLDRFFEAGMSEDVNIKSNAYKYLTTVTLTINPTPADAVVLINGEAKNTVTVPYGATAHYKVELEGYKPYTGSIELLKDTELDIELEKIEEVENEDTTDTES